MRITLPLCVLGIAVASAPTSAQAETPGSSPGLINAPGLPAATPNLANLWHVPSDAIEIKGKKSALSYRARVSANFEERPASKIRLGSLFKGQSAAENWETMFLALSAVDAAETIYCLKRDLGEEGNPLFGQHPSAKTIVLTKVGAGLVHFMLFKELNRRDPKLALRTAQLSAGMQGGVVAMNARIFF